MYCFVFYSPDAVLMVLYRWSCSLPLLCCCRDPFDWILAFMLFLVCFVFYSPPDMVMVFYRWSVWLSTWFYVNACLFCFLFASWCLLMVLCRWPWLIYFFVLFSIICLCSLFVFVFRLQPTQLLAAGRSPRRRELTALLASSFSLRLKNIISH